MAKETVKPTLAPSEHAHGSPYTPTPGERVLTVRVSDVAVSHDGQVVNLYLPFKSGNETWTVKIPVRVHLCLDGRPKTILDDQPAPLVN